MRGYPRTINSRQDVEHLLADAAYQALTVDYLQSLLDDRYGWVMVGKLADGEAGDTTTGHRVVEVRDPASGDVAERYQYAWGIQPGNGLERLGITPEECVGWGCVARVTEVPAE